MKMREIRNLGFHDKDQRDAAHNAGVAAIKGGMSRQEALAALAAVKADPAASLSQEVFGSLAALIHNQKRAALGFEPREELAPCRIWGGDLEESALRQMENARSLPISVAGALMPDAHTGYGLPVGGVLATRGAVIPYAVGVDIACRMKLTVLDMPAKTLDTRESILERAIQKETCFGVGGGFTGAERRQHRVMDANWEVTPVTAQLKDKAWKQLGTSGSGNHFVEFGELEILHDEASLPRGTYLALLSHSGSRGSGAAVAQFYSQLAKTLHRELSGELANLAWLDLDTEPGQQYWAAMNLMGEYAAANHACIHKHIAANLGAEVLLDVENHHNFAWKEEHLGEELIVHRKGATPAGAGVLGIIPGSMAAPGYLVRGLGNPESLNSASHGAGRRMSRTAANNKLTWEQTNQLLRNKRVTLMSAGLDESPYAYKDIDAVMAAQTDLVEVLARFQPRLVKMAPGGERAED